MPASWTMGAEDDGPGSTLAKAGLPDDLHVHDLRHTGNTLAAEAGASLGELVNRMGHSSTRAARIYLHTREEREQQLASTLDKMARRELKAAGAKTINLDFYGQLFAYSLYLQPVRGDSPLMGWATGPPGGGPTSATPLATREAG